MIDAITTTKIALLQDQLKLQSVSQNVANMQTPGYKRQIIDSITFDEHISKNTSNVMDSINATTLHQQGTFLQSGKPNELALAGIGYFQVQTDEGLLYTRRGDFRVNEHGQLVTFSGAHLLGKSGVIQVDDHDFTIDRSGKVFIDHHQVEQLNVVTFENNHSLNYLGQGLFSSSENPLPTEGTTHVLQGFLEQSNVKSVDEMMEIVKVSRHFEANQRVMRVADDLISKAINQLGEGNV